MKITHYKIASFSSFLYLLHPLPSIKSNYQLIIMVPPLLSREVLIRMLLKYWQINDILILQETHYEQEKYIKNPNLSGFQFGAINDIKKKKSSLLLFQFIASVVDQLI